MSTQRCLLGAAVVALLLALTGHAEAEPSGRVAVAPTSLKKIIYDVNINPLIDSNMHVIRSMLSELDPLKVEDMKMPLSEHIFLELTTGWMQNLSQLKRSGKCSVRYTSRVLTLDMNFGWDEIAIDYRYLLRVLLVSRKGDAHGQLSDLRVHVVVDLNLQAYEIRLRRLEFTDAKKLTIKLEGHLTDWLYNLMIKAITLLFKNRVLETVETKTLHIIQTNIDQINAIISKNHNRMHDLVNFIIAYDYENDVDPTSLQRFLLEKH